MTTRDAYDWWMLGAQLFAAAGTVGAVFAALWLAHRQNRARLRVSAGLVHLVGMGDAVRRTPLYVRIGITNIGQRDVVVTNLGWRFGRVRKRNFVQLPGAPPYSRQLPCRLAPGDSADFLFPRDEWVESNGEALRRAMRDYHVPIVGPHVRAVVYASTGEEFPVAVDESLVDILVAKPPGAR